VRPRRLIGSSGRPDLGSYFLQHTARMTGYGKLPVWNEGPRFCHAGADYFSTTVIAGFGSVVLMYAILVPEIRIAVVPLPRLPLPFAPKE